MLCEIFSSLLVTLITTYLFLDLQSSDKGLRGIEDGSLGQATVEAFDDEKY